MNAILQVQISKLFLLKSPLSIKLAMTSKVLFLKLWGFEIHGIHGFLENHCFTCTLHGSLAPQHNPVFGKWEWFPPELHQPPFTLSLEKNTLVTTYCPSNPTSIFKSTCTRLLSISFLLLSWCKLVLPSPDSWGLIEPNISAPQNDYDLHSKHKHKKTFHPTHKVVFLKPWLLAADTTCHY
jgi:hypothetical protein